MADRVWFTIDWTQNFGTLRVVLTQVFGLDVKNHGNIESFDIVCRLDQFTRFLIMRNARGLPNNFKSLNAKIIPDPVIPVRLIFDVSNDDKEFST